MSNLKIFSDDFYLTINAQGTRQSRQVISSLRSNRCEKRRRCNNKHNRGRVTDNSKGSSIYSDLKYSNMSSRQRNFINKNNNNLYSSINQQSQNWTNEFEQSSLKDSKYSIQELKNLPRHDLEAIIISLIEKNETIRNNKLDKNYGNQMNFEPASMYKCWENDNRPETSFRANNYVIFFNFKNYFQGL